MPFWLPVGSSSLKDLSILQMLVEPIETNKIFCLHLKRKLVPQSWFCSSGNSGYCLFVLCCVFVSLFVCFSVLKCYQQKLIPKLLCVQQVQSLVQVVVILQYILQGVEVNTYLNFKNTFYDEFVFTF